MRPWCGLDRGPRRDEQLAYNRRALVEAASNDHLEAVRTLIAAKADVNTGLIQGEPALLRAVANGNLEMVRDLIAVGAM